MSDQRLGRLMLPLRLFLGITFVYAGLIKLLDPSFLDPSAPGSMVAQLHAFARDSPLAPLIDAIGIPFATPVGLLMAFGELAVGVGAITGFTGALAAWGGFAISMLFVLTASWGTHPYFYGPDLPYAAGWLTLALVGDRGTFVLRGWLRRAATARNVSSAEWSSERRRFLEAAGVAAIALALAAIGTTRPAWLVDVLGASSTPRVPAVPPQPGPSPATGSATSPAGATAVPAATLSGPVIATVHDVATGSAIFVDPSTGDPGVLVRLQNGSIVAFDAVCTHAGCTVEYVPTDAALECPCHGAAFDPARNGAVLAGPTSQPLLALPIRIDPQTGAIHLTA